MSNTTEAKPKKKNRFKFFIICLTIVGLLVITCFHTGTLIEDKTVFKNQTIQSGACPVEIKETSLDCSIDKSRNNIPIIIAGNADMHINLFTDVNANTYKYRKNAGISRTDYYSIVTVINVVPDSVAEAVSKRISKIYLIDPLTYDASFDIDSAMTLKDDGTLYIRNSLDNKNDESYIAYDLSYLFSELWMQQNLNKISEVPSIFSDLSAKTAESDDTSDNDTPNIIFENNNPEYSIGTELLPLMTSLSDNDIDLGNYALGNESYSKMESFEYDFLYRLTKYMTWGTWSIICKEMPSWNWFYTNVGETRAY